MTGEQIFATVVPIAALLAIVPLYVWGASGSWRQALRACREYLMVMGLIVGIGGGLGLLSALASRL